MSDFPSHLMLLLLRRHRRFKLLPEFLPGLSLPESTFFSFSAGEKIISSEEAECDKLMVVHAVHRTCRDTGISPCDYYTANESAVRYLSHNLASLGEQNAKDDGYARAYTC